MIRPCKLSFSCWLQGGKNAQGCGNKWLFSCCISDYDFVTTSTFTDNEFNSLPSSLATINIHHHHYNHLQQQKQQHQHQPMPPLKSFPIKQQHQQQPHNKQNYSLKEKPLIMGKLKFKKYNNKSKKYSLRRRTDDEMIQVNLIYYYKFMYYLNKISKFN